MYTSLVIFKKRIFGTNFNRQILGEYQECGVDFHQVF